MKHYMQKLQELALVNGPLCVGLDTDPSYLPQSVLNEYSSPAQAVLAYNKAIIERIAGEKSACCFKVQIAYYEAMGLEGMKIFSETLKEIKKTNLICISDIKRGDIAATASAYARAHFSGDFESDLITINPYMGFDTLKPFTEYSVPEKNGKGAFVLLCTSNPGMLDIEHQELKNGSTVLEQVGNELLKIENEFKNFYPEQTCSPVGAVVGATQESDANYLREKYPNIFFLIPGYGAQGGAARIAASLLKNAGGVVNSSRGILCAWKKNFECQQKDEKTLSLQDITQAAASAALNSKEELLKAFKNL